MVALNLMRLSGFEESSDVQENPVVFASSKVHKEVKIILEVL